MNNKVFNCFLAPYNQFPNVVRELFLFGLWVNIWTYGATPDTSIPALKEILELMDHMDILDNVDYVDLVDHLDFLENLEKILTAEQVKIIFY